MTRPDFPYTRVPGKQWGFVRKSSLWEGPDHFLLVRGTRFSEEYRRFYFRDVQAILLRPCVRPGSIGLWMLLLTGLVWIVAVSVAVHLVPIVAFPLAILLGAGLVAKALIALRFSCRCFIQTAVSREELTSIQTTWSATKALGRMRARIIETQGDLPENAQSLLEGSDASLAVAAVLEEQPQSPQDRKRAMRCLLLAIAVFILMLVNAAQTYRMVDGPSVSSGRADQILTAIMVTATGALTVAALLFAHGLRSLRNLRILLVASLVMQGLDVYLSSTLGSFYRVHGKLVDISTTALRAWRVLVGGDDVLLALFGFGGLILIALYWNSWREG